MPRTITIDSDRQRQNWRAFETLAEQTTAVLRGFGPCQVLATQMLIRLLIADLGGEGQ